MPDTYVSRSAQDTFDIGCALGRFLRAGDSVLLYGDMGAGKSVFARGCARALGVAGDMASPTFTIMQPYDGYSANVYHFDLYRLADADELYYAGLEDKIGTDGVALIEWPQQADVCPDVRVEADLERGVDADTRFITLDFYGMDGRESNIKTALQKYLSPEGTRA